MFNKTPTLQKPWELVTWSLSFTTKKTHHFWENILGFYQHILFPLPPSVHHAGHNVRLHCRYQSWGLNEVIPPGCLRKMSWEWLILRHQSSWMFPKIMGFPPKSSILIGFSIIDHQFWGTHYFWKHPHILSWWVSGRGVLHHNETHRFSF